ncbi:MAG: SPOR domain-containing protein [Muribaculaceae bacterium]|nr:SPOR domain-containing protein [Muribaculaceae bacterium]
MITATTGRFALPVVAQSENPAIPVRINPAETIECESNGNIQINIPENILELIISDQDSQKKSTGPVIRPGVNKLTGFRIQVFSDGRSQHSLESRAKARGSAIASRFPKYRGQIYTFSSAPNWYTRVGNFQTSNEASAALAELKKAFPQFASEMRVVKSPIVIIK